MKIYIPTHVVYSARNQSNTAYLNARCSILVEVFNNTTGALLERRFNKDGGLEGDPIWGDNHPTGSEIDVPVGTQLRFKVWNISTNDTPVLVIFFRGDTSNANTVAGMWTDTSANKCAFTIKGGESREFIVNIDDYSAGGSEFYKLNVPTRWVNSGTFTNISPNDGFDYTANTVNLVYENNNIRWSKGNIAIGSQIVQPNTPTWATESGQESNPFYNNLGTQDLVRTLAGSFPTNVSDGALWRFGYRANDTNGFTKFPTYGRINGTGTMPIGWFEPADYCHLAKDWQGNSDVVLGLLSPKLNSEGIYLNCGMTNETVIQYVCQQNETLSKVNFLFKKGEVVGPVENRYKVKIRIDVIKGGVRTNFTNGFYTSITEFDFSVISQLTGMVAGDIVEFTLNNGGDQNWSDDSIVAIDVFYRLNAGTQCPLPSISISANQNGIYGIGQQAVLSATGQNITNYQWYKNGNAIPNATQSTYTITSFSNGDVGDYYCMAINNCGNGNITSTRQSSTITLSTAIGVRVRVSGFLQGDCSNDTPQYAYSSTTNNPSLIPNEQWSDSPNLIVPQHGNYYFMLRGKNDNTVTFVTTLLNTQTLQNG